MRGQQFGHFLSLFRRIRRIGGLQPDALDVEVGVSIDAIDADPKFLSPATGVIL